MMQSAEPSAKNWYALYTKPKQEFKAVEQLNRLGVANYLPVVKKRHQWSDRVKTITEPILRGYIFIYADERERLLSLEEYSIVRCVFDNGKAAVIPEWQMDNLKKFLSHETEYYLHDGLVPGTKVLIKDGPFQGIVGTIQSSENHNILSVSIDMLNRSVLAHIPKDSGFEIVKDTKSAKV